MADPAAEPNRSIGRCARGRDGPSMQAMNLLLAIILGTGAVIGALGMVLLVAGGIAASLMDQS
jgi:hypothetical protein